jgi:hypothetical protein
LAKASNHSSQDECTLKAPTPLLEKSRSQFASYHFKKTATETTETGKTKEGVVFSVFRGGCIDFGEIYVFRMKSAGHRAQEGSYWLAKTAQILQSLGSPSKNGRLQSLSRSLNTFAQGSGSTYRYGSSFRLNEESSEFTAAEEKDGFIKLQLTIETSL